MIDSSSNNRLYFVDFMNYSVKCHLVKDYVRSSKTCLVLAFIYCKDFIKVQL